MKLMVVHPSEVASVATLPLDTEVFINVPLSVHEFHHLTADSNIVTGLASNITAWALVNPSGHHSPSPINNLRFLVIAVMRPWLAAQSAPGVYLLQAWRSRVGVAVTPSSAADLQPRTPAPARFGTLLTSTSVAAATKSGCSSNIEERNVGVIMSVSDISECTALQDALYKQELQGHHLTSSSPTNIMQQSWCKPTSSPVQCGAIQQQWSKMVHADAACTCGQSSPTWIA